MSVNFKNTMDKSKGSESDKDYSKEDSPLKNKTKNRCRKRKRINSNSSTDLDDVLPENTLEVEKSLHASALKNNLDDKVVTNDHVLALVKLREEEEDSGTEDGLQPKLTRSKVKELMKVSPNSATWNSIELTPIKHIPVKTRPEVKALIAQELPEDEDDDEYEPTHDEVLSDDDHALETSNDFDSQPRTPATPFKTAQDLLQDGVFKIPQELPTRTLKKEEEATIALRTRSKLSLSSTPIEHIESSFIPPDDLPMPAVDDLWNKFLEECLNPVSNSRHEEDDEADPEYNVAADPDAHDEDEEALENSIIKISKKELNDLVTEIFNVLPEGSEEQLANDYGGVLGELHGSMIKPPWVGKREPLSDEELNRTAELEMREIRSVGKIEPGDQMNADAVSTTALETHSLNTSSVNTASGSVRISVLERRSGVQAPRPELSPPAPLRRLRLRDAPPDTLHVHMHADMQMYPEQVLILEQQLRQHVQLSTTYFLQLYVHPVHWSYAPKYKEYLESLDKLTQTNPKSVANVCNLKPALELVKGWEDSVSENTPENAQLVEFIQKEVEKSRKRMSQNSMYLGDFPELFKRVVANSSVFLYPYLLPPSPCRADLTNRRYGFLISEDELMVLGLDQFSKYVDLNPDIFKHPRCHPRKRWSLSTAAELTCKHMFPWMNVRSLLGHVHLVRRTGDRGNPIVKYFQDNIIVPVKHKLLPYNLTLTLYEQPEFELPRIWIKYLSKSSKRFKDSLYRKSQTAIQPSGVEVAMNILSQQKLALPNDFTKTIQCDRINKIQKTEPNVQNKIEVQIQSTVPQVYIAANIYTLVNTSNGAQLMPLQVNTSTVNSTTAPITTPILLNNIPPPINVKMDDVIQNDAKTSKQIKLKETEPDHCECCIMLTKICKRRKTLITDYFKSNIKSYPTCGCRGRSYPKITNKLKILVNSYKLLSVNVYNDLMRRIELCKRGGNKEKKIDFNDKDFADALNFQIRLIQRTNIARDNRKKLKVNNALANFNTDEGDPLELAKDLHNIFDVELADLYNEFLMFLTPKQADRIDKFKDYFIINCLQDLVIKIEEHLKNNSEYENILVQLQTDIFYNKYTACGICCRLLQHMHKHPGLARYTFDLFPHMWKEDHCNNRKDTQQNDTQVTPVVLQSPTESRADVTLVSQRITASQHNDTVVTSAEATETVDYEADDSSSDEEEAEEVVVEDDTSNAEVTKERDIKLVTTIKYEEVETDELSITKTEVQGSSSSDMSMLVMSDDESIKSEPAEWKRDDDKLILEVLKQFLTPEQIKDKTIIEVIEEKHLLMMIADSLSKSLEDVRDRVLYLLKLLGSETQ